MVGLHDVSQSCHCERGCVTALTQQQPPAPDDDVPCVLELQRQQSPSMLDARFQKAKSPSSCRTAENALIALLRGTCRVTDLLLQLSFWPAHHATPSHNLLSTRLLKSSLQEIANTTPSAAVKHTICTTLTCTGTCMQNATILRHPSCCFTRRQAHRTRSRPCPSTTP